MQRREAKIGLRDRKCHQRPKARNDTDENPHRNGPFGAGREICGLEGLDGGRTRARTWDPLIRSQRIYCYSATKTFRPPWIGCLTFAGTERKGYGNQSRGRGGTGRRKGLKISRRH